MHEHVYPYPHTLEWLVSPVCVCVCVCVRERETCSVTSSAQNSCQVRGPKALPTATDVSGDISLSSVPQSPPPKPETKKSHDGGKRGQVSKCTSHTLYDRSFIPRPLPLPKSLCSRTRPHINRNRMVIWLQGDWPRRPAPRAGISFRPCLSGNRLLGPQSPGPLKSQTLTFPQDHLGPHTFFHCRASSVPCPFSWSRQSFLK